MTAGDSESVMEPQAAAWTSAALSLEQRVRLLHKRRQRATAGHLWSALATVALALGVTAFALLSLAAR